MGLEIKTRARHKKIEAIGKLHLDSQSLTFNCPQLKWRVELGGTTKARAKDGWLIVASGRDKAEFEIGEAADKWVTKIVQPPNRLQKLGVKPGIKFWISSGFEDAFRDELGAVGASVVKKVPHCQIAFLLLKHRDELGRLMSVANELPPRVNLWVVWPKGAVEISQSEVLAAAADCGMGPSKTAAFDPRHSSMRFAVKKAT